MTLKAVLTDISANPAAVVAGVTVGFNLGGQACTATTDATGVAACAVTPPGPPAAIPLSATFDGSSILLGSFALLSALGLPVAYALGLAAICAALWIPLSSCS